MGAKLDLYKTSLRKKAQKGFLGYPLVTIAFYGPDDRRATKVAVGIINNEDEDSPREMNRWFTDKGDIRRDGEVFEAISRLIRARNVQSVAMSEAILGCPHEEGIDYPERESCPQCPFWAGRRRPLDEMSEPSPFPSRYAMEKAFSETGSKKASGSSPLEQAQDLMWSAWDNSNPKQRVAMARQALELSADCADAYVMLAQETAQSSEQALGLYEKGMEAGERGLGPQAFQEGAGHFWEILETRPYMRARKGVAECLLEMRRYDEAIAHFRELLRLNPNDNQGNRDVLSAVYLETGRNAEALDLLNQYPEGITATWSYTNALVRFRLRGRCSETMDALNAARKNNPYVPNYLRGLKRMPRVLPPYFRLGSVEEAVIYADLYGKCWTATPGALEWLALDKKEK
jgi:tetratricopeptide (TPR) repeat protein